MERVAKKLKLRVLCFFLCILITTISNGNNHLAITEKEDNTATKKTCDLALFIPKEAKPREYELLDKLRNSISGNDFFANKGYYLKLVIILDVEYVDSELELCVRVFRLSDFRNSLFDKELITNKIRTQFERNLPALVQIIDTDLIDEGCQILQYSVSLLACD